MKHIITVCLLLLASSYSYGQIGLKDILIGKKYPDGHVIETTIVNKNYSIIALTLNDGRCYKIIANCNIFYQTTEEKRLSEVTGNRVATNCDNYHEDFKNIIEALEKKYSISFKDEIKDQHIIGKIAEIGEIVIRVTNNAGVIITHKGLLKIKEKELENKRSKKLDDI